MNTKKYLLKLVSLLMVLALSAAQLSLPVFAEQADADPPPKSSPAKPPVSKPAGENKTSAETKTAKTSTHSYLYSQLSAGEKKIYKAFYNKSYDNPSLTKLSFDIGGEIKSSALSGAIMRAYDAYRHDYPIVSWGIPTGFKASNDSSGYATDVEITLTNPLKITKENVKKINEAVAKIVTTAKKETTKKDQLKKAHDELMKLVQYDTQSKPAQSSFYAAGVFLKGKAVCEGYAKAFKMVCDGLGIESVIIPGQANNGKKTENHMWNYIKMDDGKWYAVDITWNDQQNVKNEVFLVGADTILTSFTNKKFTSGRTAYDAYNPELYTGFKFPAISKAAYKS